MKIQNLWCTTVPAIGVCLASLHPNPVVAVGPRGARTIDVKHVAIDLRFDWPHRQAFGTAAITLAPLRAARTITLDAGMLTIQSIALTNGPPLAFSYDGGDKNDGLVITLDRIHPAGTDLTIRITYRTNWVNESDPNNLAGSDGKGIRLFAPTSTEPVKRRQIWSQGFPESNRYWFPGSDRPDDLRTTEFTATVAPPLQVISNGRLINTTTNPDGTQSFRWRMDHPYQNHLTSFVVGEFTDVRQDHGGTPLHSLGYPDEADAVAATVVRLPDMVRFFADQTGVPYPFASYSQVFVQDVPWGTGNATATTLTENMVDDARTHADWRYLWDGLEAEAVASQWFGVSLAARSWSDVWLARGFAHYFDGLYNEHVNGRAEFLWWHLFGDQSTNLGDWNAGVRHPVVTTDPANALAFATDNVPYARGALVLHMLRKHLGETKWQEAIKRYVGAHSGRLVTTADLQTAVEAVSGESLAWFFDQWLYGIGHPVFQVTKTYNASTRRLTIKVRQTQRRDPKSEYAQVQFFRGKVDIEVDDRVVPMWLEPKAENVFVVPSPEPPKLVHFDFESTWIKEITFSKPLDELLYQVQNDRDVLGRRWAMAQVVNLGTSDSASAGAKAKIAAALREVMLGDSYWRVRAAAIGQLQRLLVPANSTQPAALDEATTSALISVIERDRSWVRSGAIGLLGMTRDPKYADLYLAGFTEESHPVINAAAAALGKSKSPKAFQALSDLIKVPSWKGENILSGLLGLKELGDPRGAEAGLNALQDQTSHRWTLATSIWDYRMAGAETMAALGQGARAYPIIRQRFDRAVAEDDINDIFSNVLLLIAIADSRGLAVFDGLKAKFKADANAMSAIASYESQLKAAIKAP